MQIISHNNTTLTVCQRFFIEKSLELLYIGSIDSYRVRLNNPKSILEELRYCLNEFQNGRIKHFQTIKSKEGKKALIDEAITLISYSPNYLTFNSIKDNYVRKLLKDTDEYNYKRTISGVEILLKENADYVEKLLDGLKVLIDTNNTSVAELEKIDNTLNFLFSELINSSFSKGFLYKLVYGIFVNTLKAGSQFDDHFNNFRTRVLLPKSSFEVIFRIDTSQKVYDSISAITHVGINISDDLNDINLTGRHGRELETFNATAAARKFIKCAMLATDYLSALKDARKTLAEVLDVIDLGLSDEFLQIHSRALVIDSRSPEKAQFQNNVNILDGKYRVEKDHYIEFTRKLPPILNDPRVSSETKEKVKSAIRYLRLGNQSTEVEHKFINYWIGLEYLFSNYESQSTINRIKEHFINAHSIAYVKRNTYAFKKSFSQLSGVDQAKVPSYSAADFSCLKLPQFYDEAGTHLLASQSLLAYRALKLKQWFFHTGKPANATDYLRKHRSNLEIHFTRIYRLRNEIIHDAATNTNNEHIASNLRYYLTFALNELIDFFSRNIGQKTSIEEYFIMNEIIIGNIEQNGFLLTDLLDVECSLEFIS